MTSTALGAETKKEEKIIFICDAHEKFVKVKSFAPRQIQRRLFAALVTLSRKVF